MAVPRTYAAQTIRVYRSPRTSICHQVVEYVVVQGSAAALDTDIVTRAKEAAEVEVSAAKGLDSEPCVPRVDGIAFAVGTTSGER